MTSEPGGAPTNAPAPDDGPSSPVLVVVCSTCRTPDDPTAEPRPGAALYADALRAAVDSGVEVRAVNCLANCKRGLSAAVMGAGAGETPAWTYVFGDLNVDSGADLVLGAQLLAASEDGLMPFRPRPKSLKTGMVARIPAFTSALQLPKDTP